MPNFGSFLCSLKPRSVEYVTFRSFYKPARLSALPVCFNSRTSAFVPVPFRFHTLSAFGWNLFLQILLPSVRSLPESGENPNGGSKENGIFKFSHINVRVRVCVWGRLRVLQDCKFLSLPLVFRPSRARILQCVPFFLCFPVLEKICYKTYLRINTLQIYIKRVHEKGSYIFCLYCKIVYFCIRFRERTGHQVNDLV